MREGSREEGGGVARSTKTPEGVGVSRGGATVAETDGPQCPEAR